MRTQQEFTQAEQQAFLAFANEHHIIIDSDHPDGTANVNLIADYFQKTWPNDMTPATLAHAWGALKPHVKIKCEGRKFAEKVMSEAQQQTAENLWNWFNSQKMLTNSNDDSGWYNYGLLLQELRGRKGTPEEIHQAMGRIGFRAGRQLVYQERPSTTDSRQHQQQGDDADFFSTKGMQKLSDGTWGRSSSQKTRDMISRDAAANPASIRGNDLQERAKEQAQRLRGNTHSETDQISRVFVMDSKNEIDWERTLSARLKMQTSLSNRSVR